MPQRPARPSPEDSLRHSEEMFRLLVESVREYAIFMLDPTGHVATWNQGAERLKGYRAPEITGQHFSVFYPPEVSRAVIDAELVTALEEGQFRDEGWRVRKDGSRFWADVTITPVRDTTGILRGFAKVTRDMTARRAADEERAELIREQAARVEAERANRMKDEFLATLSHELRTPLNAIVGWAHILDTEPLDGPAFKKAVEVIRRNALAQTQLISDILDISRIQSGRVHLNVRSMDVGKVVEAALDSLAPAAAAKDIVLDRELEPGLNVAGDSDRLQQVAWNLLSNAVKFTPRGGRVEIRLRRREEEVELTVRDDGPGIEPSFLPHVFEPFRQADSSASRAHGGLGLGLAIVRHLVELHGGRVRAQSEGAGKGAAFVVDLPLSTATAVELPADDDGAREPRWDTIPRLAGLTVLVVEDDEDARELIEETLHRLGARVESARSAAEARHMLGTVHPDVLLSDIEMPGESGYEMMRQVRALPPAEGGLVPAVALTAYARTEDRLRALGAGFQMHLAKPVHPTELAASIATLTGRSRPV